MQAVACAAPLVLLAAPGLADVAEAFLEKSGRQLSFGPAFDPAETARRFVGSDPDARQEMEEPVPGRKAPSNVPVNVPL